MNNDGSHHITKPPFEGSYWVLEGALLAGCHPGDFDLNVERHKLGALLDSGVVTLVNLLEDTETNPDDGELNSYAETLRALAAERSIQVSVLHFPIRDMSVPDDEAMQRILDAIDGELSAARTVYIHCYAGVGRTGTVVGCWLARHGIAVSDDVFACMNILRDFNPLRDLTSPQTLQQRNFVRAWEQGK